MGKMTTLKRCRKCLKLKGLDEFYKTYKGGRSKDGYRGACKKCMNDYQIEYRRKNPNCQIEYRRKNPNYQIEYRRKNPNYEIEYRRKNPRTRQYSRKVYLLNREREIQRTQEYHKKHPERNRAHCIVRDALKKGIIVRPKKCSECPRENLRIQAHHEDYSKPLDIEWLCAQCHKKRYLEKEKNTSL